MKNNLRRKLVTALSFALLGCQGASVKTDTGLPAIEPELDAVFSEVASDVDIDANEMSELEKAIEQYKTYSHRKALAAAVDEDGAWAYGFAHDNPLERTAKNEALRICEEYREKNDVKTPCSVYMVGNRNVRQLNYTGSDSESAQRLAEKSGLLHAVQSFPEQMENHVLQQKAFSENPEIEEEILAALISFFDAEAAENNMIRFVTETTSSDDRNAILAWLDSDLGQKVSQAETHAASVEAQSEMLRYMADIQERPPRQSRIEQIQRLERTAKLTESNLQSFEVMLVGMLTTFNEAMPPEKKESNTELNQVVEETLSELRPLMEQLLFQQILLSSHYAYRDFSDEELERYIDFLSRDEGQKYVQLNEGIYEVYAEIFKAFIPEIKALADQVEND